jgi:hypothetical protein
VQRRPDWDREGRERRAREHGRERAWIDPESVEELDATLAARQEREKTERDSSRQREEDELDRLTEPARLVAKEYRSVPRDEKPPRREEFLERLRTAISHAVAQPSTPKVQLLLREYGRSLETRFFKPPRKR